MEQDSKIVTPGPGNSLKDDKGNAITPPPGWKFLKAGDAGITRKVTSSGPYWRVQVKKGRRTMSLGLWAPSENIDKATAAMNATRQTEEYHKKLESSRRRRDKIQSEYVDEFYEQIKKFLNFHPTYAKEESEMARLICDHATPVGSGTVARTTRIPVEERASRAVIAWMRHQTTEYDRMKIARIKGERRNIRRQLAGISIALLNSYRKGEQIPADCPLWGALKK